MADFSNFPSLDKLASRLQDLWPEHATYLDKSFAERSADVMSVSEQVASCALRLASHMEGGLTRLCDDYRFLCEKIVLPEEFHFRRHNAYRLSSFSDALRECYSNAPFMERYMNGLLLSYAIWNNHAHAIAAYVLEYLPSLRPTTDLLEIGPGHGLLLFFAASSGFEGSVSGWDVSPTSIAQTRHTLDLLGVNRPVTLTLQNLFEVDPARQTRQFDAITMSEILEHLEQPVEALKAATQWLRPGGSIWVNVPANSPAPDHIFLVRSPEHAESLMRDAGLDLVASRAFPMTGTTLEKARKGKLAISCVVVGRRSD
ncbi:MAG TPA: class I SAM-dependent methyltransferase [Rhizomicrobium sp.]|nr:class I SAM-dependent methyltransferase [Rhizomicrobium sp.]